MKVTDYIVRSLVESGINRIFGYTGGSIADLIDSICNTDHIEFIQLYHEQAASYAANAYAQVTGSLGVAISSSGPGAINMINGIANAFYDSIPCLFITGNVHTYSQRADEDLRQNAFQEADIVDMVSGITKYAVKIQSERHVPYCLNKALHLATSERKGPVLLDIPYDLQRREIQDELFPDNHLKHATRDIATKYDTTERILNFISCSNRPLLLAGGGALGARKCLREFIVRTHIPVVTSLRARDIIEETYNYGFIGSYGNRCANLAIYNCDLLIVAGSRLDERQMGFRKEEFAPHAKIIRVDVDFGELYHQIEPDIAIQAHIEDVFSCLCRQNLPQTNRRWREILDLWKKRYRMCGKEIPVAHQFISYICEHLKGKKTVIADVGQNEMNVAQAIKINKADFFLCSAGLGSMGYSLPASIGAYYARPEGKILSFNGDGGLQMNIQELQTIIRERLPIKIVVFNNRSLGLIRNLQDKLFSKRYFASVLGYSPPEFSKIAVAYGLKYIKINDTQDFHLVIDMLDNEESAFIEVSIPLGENVYPEPGEKIYEQRPVLTDEQRLELKNDLSILEEEKGL